MAFTKPRLILQSGERADQPDADQVAEGTLYSVSDGQVIERSDGSSWAEFGLTARNGQVFSETATGFTGNGGMTWSGVTQVDYSYSLIGSLCLLFYNFGPSTVSGTLNNTLSVTLPAGIVAKKTQQTTCLTSDGTNAAGQAYVVAGQTTLNFRKLPSANWNASVNVFIQGTHIFEVQ